ncbi:MAG TPA: aromatic ring-hydroxylating dioxygenase subunit alpha [Elusimicrobiota bacterium]|jgi:Rieske 2Fe-2S family protein|nr:aromatic ring-hydroxylating dioxygenase subunit alpha [Elusimicrobiota bacterium]
MATKTDFKKRGSDYALLDGQPTIEPEYFHSPEIYRAELDKVFCGRWLLACREEEVAKPGDYHLVPVGDESIILVRGKDGELRAHFNVCRHRGTRLCVEPKGCFANAKIRCPYHAWSYGLDGRLEAAPLMDEMPSFKLEEHPLYAAAVRVWEGFVFLNLSEKPGPFEAEMGALNAERFGKWHLKDLRIAHKIEYDLKCNWKIVLHNYQECYHCPGVHPRLSRITHFRGAAHDCMEGSVIGGYMTMEAGKGGMTMDGAPAGPPLGDIRGEDLKRVYYYSVFPNLLLSPHPDFVIYHRIRPVAVDHTLLDCHWLLAPETIADPKKMERFKSAVEFWDITNREDWQVCEQMQQGTASRRFRRGTYSGQEDVLAALDKEFAKAVGRRPAGKA